MNKLNYALVAGAAALGLAGAAAASERKVVFADPPAGAVADKADKDRAATAVMLVPVGRLFPIAWAGSADPFAVFDRLFAEMRARHVAMMRQAAALAAQAGTSDRAGDLRFVADGGLPTGSYSYTFVSTGTGDGACGRVVEIRSRPNAAPQRISRSFGNCDGAAPGVQPATPARDAAQPPLPTI